MSYTIADPPRVLNAFSPGRTLERNARHSRAAAPLKTTRRTETAEFELACTYIGRKGACSAYPKRGQLVRVTPLATLSHGGLCGAT